jgi:hypothetical protein
MRSLDFMPLEGLGLEVDPVTGKLRGSEAILSLQNASSKVRMPLHLNI